MAASPDKANKKKKTKLFLSNKLTKSLNPVFLAKAVYIFLHSIYTTLLSVLKT